MRADPDHHHRHEHPPKRYHNEGAAAGMPNYFDLKKSSS